MIKRILPVAFALSTTTYVQAADDMEFRLEGAYLKPKGTVGAFVNTGPFSPRRGVGAQVDQEMDSMQGLKLSALKSWDHGISWKGAVYTPLKGVMSPTVILSNASENDLAGTADPEDGFGVSAKYSMLLAELGAEYSMNLSRRFESFVGAGLAFAHFYDGGTESLLNRTGHPVDDFDIENKLTWYLSTGASYEITENLSLTGSVSYVHLKTDAIYKFTSYQGISGATSEATQDKIKLKINPVVLSLGASWKF